MTRTLGATFVAALTAAAVAMTAFTSAVMVGMVVVVGLDLAEGPGKAVYLCLILGAAAACWAVTHFALKAIVHRVPVPWTVWIGMLVPPVTWAAAWLVGGRIEAPLPGLVGLAGTTVAWFTLGGDRWTRR